MGESTRGIRVGSALKKHILWLHILCYAVINMLMALLLQKKKVVLSGRWKHKHLHHSIGIHLLERNCSLMPFKSRICSRQLYLGNFYQKLGFNYSDLSIKCYCFSLIIKLHIEFRPYRMKLSEKIEFLVTRI